MNTLSEIKEMVLQYPEGQVIFDDPLKIKSSPHVLVFTCYGAWAGHEGIFLLDGAGVWHGPLLESDVNGKMLIQSLYQRMRILTSDVKKVAV